MSKKVKVFKIITGQDIVAEKIDNKSDNNKTCLRKPLQLVPIDDNRIAPVPFNPLSEEDEVLIRANHIICESKPAKRVEDMYIQATTSISLPTSNNLDINPPQF